MKINYTLEFDGDYSVVDIPQLEGREIIETPNEGYYNDEYLDIIHFRYTACFDEYDSEEFTTINIQKEGGDDESASASSYYEQLTREEADCIIGEFIKKALGIEDFELETDSDDLIEENEIFDDEDEDEDDEDEDDEDDEDEDEDD